MLASRRAIMLLSAFKPVRLRSDVATWQQLGSRLEMVYVTNNVAVGQRLDRQALSRCKLIG